mgnify:CR=1 FL=1
MANLLSENAKKTYVRIIADRMKSPAKHDLVKVSAKAKRLYDEVGGEEYSKLIFKQIRDSAGVGYRNHVGIKDFLKGIHDNSSERRKGINRIAQEKLETHKLTAMRSVYKILETELTPYEVLRCVYSKPEAEEIVDDGQDSDHEEGGDEENEDEEIFDDEEEEPVPVKLVREPKRRIFSRPSTFSAPTYGFGTPRRSSFVPPTFPTKKIEENPHSVLSVKKTISKKKSSSKPRLSRTIYKKPIYVEEEVDNDDSSSGVESMDEEDDDARYIVVSDDYEPKNKLKRNSIDDQADDDEEILDEDDYEDEEPAPRKLKARKLFFDFTGDASS